jgi:uncharacterized membrane protein YcaP (DUF421 family)
LSHTEVVNPLPIVRSGMILDSNLRCIAKDRQWLINQLKTMGYEREDIPYIQSAVWTSPHQMEITFSSSL